MEFLKAFFVSSMTIFLLISLLIIFSLLIAYFIKRWQIIHNQQQKETSVSFDIIEEPSAILKILNTVIKQKARFSVRLNNRGRSFNSSLLKTDPPTLLIDALFPYEGNELIEHSRFINVGFTITEIEKIPYTFDSTYIQSEIFNGYPALRISIPNTVTRDQKRKYHRVEPSVNEPVYVKFVINDNEVREKVANISGGGIAFYTNLGKSVLWPGRKIEPVSITLPTLPIISCLAIVYTVAQVEFPVLINGNSYHYYCGAEFVNMDETTRDKIIHYVIEKERSELKRLNREFE